MYVVRTYHNSCSPSHAHRCAIWGFPAGITYLESSCPAGGNRNYDKYFRLKSISFCVPA